MTKTTSTRAACSISALVVLALVLALVPPRGLATTLPNDIAQLATLYTSWNLGSVAGWSNPTVLDPCDNAAMFATISCDNVDPANRRVTSMYVSSSQLHFVCTVP